MKSKNVKPGMRVRIITEATVVEWDEAGTVLDDITEKVKQIKPEYTVSIEDYEALEDVVDGKDRQISGLRVIEAKLEAQIERLVKFNHALNEALDASMKADTQEWGM